MHPLSASQLLAVWERGRSLPATRRALALLQAATPEATIHDLACLSIGRRDGRLLELREWIFGPDVSARAGCPSCGEPLEMDFRVADVVVGADPEPNGGAQSSSPTTSAPEIDDLGRWQPFESDGYELRFRLPNSGDLEHLAEAGRAGADPGRGLLERCVSGVTARGVVIAVEDLPDRVIGAVGDRMAEEDPQADVSLDLRCPACDHAWELPFDIVGFFWSEIDSWARRTLRDVDTLAKAYGWTEGEILALPPWRRQYYTELARA